MTTPQQGASELTREQLIMALRNVDENHESWSGTARAALNYIERTTAVAPAVPEPVTHVLTNDAEIDAYMENMAAPPERTAQPTIEDGFGDFDKLCAEMEASHPKEMKRGREWAKQYIAERLAAQPTGASDYCKGAGCVHQQFGCPAWSKGENPFAAAQPNWREPLEAWLTKWENELRKVGGMDNELISVPAGGVRDMLAELRTTIEALAAQHGDGGTTK